MGSDGFGIENLPYGVVADGIAAPRPAVRFGEAVLVLEDVFEDRVFSQPSLNAFIAQGPAAWSEARARLAELLADGSHPELIPLARLQPVLPLEIGDYVDFYSSLEHATNVGKMLRPDDPLMPNWRRLPVGYHGRSGTVVVSGTPVARPAGQIAEAEFSPEPALDFELELACVCGGGAEVFGFALLNDWSARRIQAFEYQPLGPFLSKAFATSLSPWIVPMQALEPHLVDGPPQDPEPLPHLRAPEPRALDVELEVELNGDVITRTNASSLYWSFRQQLAHLRSAGIEPRPGDLFASGTISTDGQPGCQLERGGPFLEDGDTIIMRGQSGPISFGEVVGQIQPAPRDPL